MGWYTVSVLVGYRTQSNNVVCNRITEQLYLTEASSIDEAVKRGSTFGKAYVDANCSMTIEGQPGYAILLGIRNATEILNLDDPVHAPPRSGTEIGYNIYELDDANDVDKILKGEDVKLTLEGP